MGLEVSAALAELAAGRLDLGMLRLRMLASRAHEHADRSSASAVEDSAEPRGEVEE